MTLKEVVRAAKREYLVQVLERHNGCITKAALEAGVHRATFHSYMDRYGVTVERVVKAEI